MCKSIWSKGKIQLERSSRETMASLRFVALDYTIYCWSNAPRTGIGTRLSGDETAVSDSKLGSREWLKKNGPNGDVQKTNLRILSQRLQSRSDSKGNPAWFATYGSMHLDGLQARLRASRWASWHLADQRAAVKRIVDQILRFFLEWKIQGANLSFYLWAG